MPKAVARGLAAALALGWIGCARPAARDPGEVVRAYAAALARDDPHAAWRLLSRAERAALPEPELVARWRESGPERKDQAARLDEWLARPTPPPRATVESQGRTALLVRDPDGWKLSAPTRAAAGAATPEQALAHLAEALAARDAPLLLDLLSPPLRAAVERELDARLAALRPLLGHPVASVGDRASVSYGDGYHVDLVRENGNWRVADFN